MEKKIMYEVSSHKELQALKGCTITNVLGVDENEDAGGVLLECEDKNGNEVSLCISEDGSWSFYDGGTKYLTNAQFGELAMLAGCSDVESVHFNNVDPLVEIAIKPIGTNAADRVLTILRGIFPMLKVVGSKWEFDGELHPMYLCSDPSYNLMIAVAVLPEGFNGTDGD